jgi:F-type H+-transporting ATPase subunit b
MTFNASTFVFEVINFLVLAYVLQRVLYRPLHDAIDRRRDEIDRREAETERALRDAQAREHKVDEQLAAIQSQRQDLLAKARQEADVERQRLLSDAAKETSRQAATAREALKRERSDALHSLQEDVVQEAVALAERLLRDASGDDLDSRLASRVADTVRSLPEEERASVTRSWNRGDTATLEAAHDLPAEAVSKVRDALSETLGEDVSLQVLRVTELQSGVRLRLDGHVWDASLAGQIEKSNDEH